MASYTFLFVIVAFQAYVVQTTFAQCLGIPINTGIYEGGCGIGFGNSLGNSYGWSGGENIGAYGGAGTGDLDVAGELAVAGITAVSGQMPILGAVQFGGEVPAAGIVTIVGKCGCDCNGTPLF